MWPANNKNNNTRGNNDIVNERGQAIRLFVPSLYQQQHQPLDLTISTIGGRPTTTTAATTTRKCPQCQRPLVQLVQFAIPAASTKQRTCWILQACNSSACVAKLFSSSSSSAKQDKTTTLHNSTTTPTTPFAIGGQGIVICERIDFASTPAADSTMSQSSPPRTNAGVHDDSNDWDDDAEEDDDGDDHPKGIMTDQTNGADSDMDELEAKLGFMEATTEQPKASTRSPKKNKKKPPSSNRMDNLQNLDNHATEASDSNSNLFPQQQWSFPGFKLSEVREPPAPRPSAATLANLHDPDDVGLSNDSADHIQRLLQKYMDEEEDMAIVQMLQQQQQNVYSHGKSDWSATFPGGGGGGGGITAQQEEIEEPDEPLTLAERTLFQYLDRIKRQPRQVIRYAPGGVPMWSIPEPRSGLPIPQCPCCGKDRIFQFQVVPQILHVLQVDQQYYASKGEESSPPLSTTTSSSQQPQLETKASNSQNTNQRNTAEESTLGRDGGGMNFGNLCLYICVDFDKGEERCTDQGVVVIQASVDENVDDDDNYYYDDDETDRRPLHKYYYDQTPAVVGSDANRSGAMDDDDDEGWEPDGS
ncbi:hypothetical protein ACA910_006705 [Epithemia clementina (nom. ined.)]